MRWQRLKTAGSVLFCLSLAVLFWFTFNKPDPTPAAPEWLDALRVIDNELCAAAEDLQQHQNLDGVNHHLTWARTYLSALRTHMEGDAQQPLPSP